MLIGLVIFFVCLIAAGALVIANAGWIAQRIPFSAEKRFVEPYISILNSEYGEDVSGDEQEYLQGLTDDLAAAMGVKDEIELTVHFVDSPATNAIATIGGHIFVFRGLVERMPDENSLAMVLAHEVAHVEHRDPIAAVGRGFTAIFILSFIGGELPAAGGEVGMQLGLNAYSRRREQSADIEALKTLAARYGHVAGYNTFFQWVVDIEGEDELPDLLSTHPGMQSRIDVLDAHVDERGYAIGSTVPIPDVF